VVFTPHAALVQNSSLHADTGADAHDGHVLQRRWSDVLARDPYYNPNFSRDAPDYEPNLTALTKP